MKPTGFTFKSPNSIVRVLHTPVHILIPNRDDHETIDAIWDTGATGSVITRSVVERLGIAQTGISKVFTANGEAEQRTFTIDIGLPNGIRVQSIVATEVDALSGGAEALIGMDVITLGDLSVTNHNGSTCMSFRIPSLHEIDFVKSPNFGVVKVTKSFGNTVARTAPCPCKSGKQYKRCCGK